MGRYSKIYKILSCLLISSISLIADDSQKHFSSQIKPVLDKYCLGCHSTKKHKGDLDLEKYSSLEGLRQKPKIWQHVIEQMESGEMPPKKKKQPTPEERKALLGWIKSNLDSLARSRLGDPGPVVLRRLSNAEYTYTLRDLIGIKGLNPAREFPVDGAAGEGFTNTGMSLVMSPALITKFLNAGKEVSQHAILVPDGIRWSKGTSRRDCTNELLSEIRNFYSKYTVPGNKQTVTLQGILLDRSNGRKLPHELYLKAAFEIQQGSSRASVVEKYGISDVYLEKVIAFLKQPSMLAGDIQDRWKTVKVNEIGALAQQLDSWQNVLFKFNPVGQVGFPNGPKTWMEADSPLRDHIKLSLTIPKDLKDPQHTVSIAVSDNADGKGQGQVKLYNAKMIFPDNKSIALKDVRLQVEGILGRKKEILVSTEKALAAAAKLQESKGQLSLKELASEFKIEEEFLSAWLTYLGIESGGSPALTYLNNKLNGGGNHPFIKGWGVPQTPNLVTNPTDQMVRIPGIAKPHGVFVHPSPKLNICVGWRSPVSGKVRVSGAVTHAHHDCGNGVDWKVQYRKGSHRRQLSSGISHGPKAVEIAIGESITVNEGDFISLIVGPRDGNHSCDLTDVEFNVELINSDSKKWSLTKDVSADPLQGNPHADSYGTANIWHFYTEPVSGKENQSVIPQGSLLTRWLEANDLNEKKKLASDVQKLINSAKAPNGPDGALYKQLTSFNGPLLKSGVMKGKSVQGDLKSSWGIDPQLFKEDLQLQGGKQLSFELPSELAAGCRIEMEGQLVSADDASSVRVELFNGKDNRVKNNWWLGNPNLPLLVKKSGPVKERLEKVFHEIRKVFPAAVCYTRIVPVDDVVTLKVFFREDDQLQEMALNDSQKAYVNKLWEELIFVSHEPLIQFDAYEQIWQYATQGGSPEHLEPMRAPITKAAEDFKKQLVAVEPKQLDAVVKFSAKAYRRPLTGKEEKSLRDLYSKLRSQNMSHEDSIKLLLARVFISSGFLYKEELPPAGDKQKPVNAFELASRLSYFLWASQPDEELMALAQNGAILKPEVLRQQVGRMLKDPRISRLAKEFGCAWLHIHGFDQQGEKSEKHFPTFNSVKGALYEESIQLFTDFFQNNKSVLNLLDGNEMFVNETLAKHYNIPGISGKEFRKIGEAGKYHRGGILGLGATLAQHSGASRTSPILRGNWVSEVLLGEKLPKPPKDVPQLPEGESIQNLSMREITEKHTNDPRCARCHARIDPFGFSLEAYDAIGRWREKDPQNKPYNTTTKVPDGTVLEGMNGLKKYLLTTKKYSFVRQFNKKLLGYALGRSVILSDEPFLDSLQEKFAQENFKINSIVEEIVLSRQFREIRGRDAEFENVPKED
ncbi:MAG: DUF1592 domain-containing protein [Lentisphaeraceae bacterium]|nr:DUF1592 domain-containing protein [Lentisphaeraceae bacterium]